MQFEDVSAGSGDAFERADVGRGAAVGDVDNDGDLDILVTNNGGRVELLLNESRQVRPGVLVSLVGLADNSHGIGARVGLVQPDGTMVWRRVHTDGSYLSSSDPRIHFAVPSIDSGLAFVVEWQRSAPESWRDVRPATGRTVALKQGTGTTGAPRRE
jgi:hypothetical protein